MSLLGKIVSVGVGEITQGIGSLAKDIREAITGEPSPEKRAELQLRLQELELKAKELDNQLLLAQTEINKAEAQNPNWFTSGWRPAIGWVCALSLGIYYIPQFIVATVLWFKLSWQLQAIAPYPISSISGLTELIMGMLGLAGLRTFEKTRGVAR